MSSLLVAKLAVLFGVLFIAMFLRAPFFLACFSSAAAYAVIFRGSIPNFVFGQTFVQGISNSTYASVIFYFFLGAILNNGGLGDRIIKFGDACIGHIKGSLSHINIIASIIFAGVSGSAIADTASIGNLMIPMMKKQGYEGEYSAAVTQMSSIIGPIIPPSTTFVFLAMMMDLSIRKLFLCGLVPGIVMGLLELLYSVYISHKRNYPSQPKFAGWKKVWVELKENFWALILPIIIVIC
ncbi:MAG: TRAP transporter large permease subunit, partial [Sphaerochaetaceae bacterium]|nr:TRAP transporter large permease subunit [Sphaerochaetaceae bacterium]